MLMKCKYYTVDENISYCKGGKLWARDIIYCSNSKHVSPFGQMLCWKSESIFKV